VKPTLLSDVVVTTDLQRKLEKYLVAPETDAERGKRKAVEVIGACAIGNGWAFGL
jgi:hypothetical protein